MTISPFQVYLVLQMDTAWVTLLVMCIIAGALTLIGMFGCAYPERRNCYSDAEYNEKVENADKQAKRVNKGLRITLTLAAVLAVLPDTKTLAAVFIVPPLVNEGLPVVTEEARELYGLAREALEDAVRDGASSPASTEEPQP